MALHLISAINSQTIFINYTLFLIRLQEIVPLNAGNVLGYENNKISQKWNSLLRAALNKKAISIADQDHKVVGVGELQKVYPVKDNIHNDQVRNFQCIVHKQMVGVFISVWVSSHLLPYIYHPSVSCVACGLLGCLGNKVIDIIYKST